MSKVKPHSFLIDTTTPAFQLVVIFGIYKHTGCNKKTKKAGICITPSVEAFVHIFNICILKFMYIEYLTDVRIFSFMLNIFSHSQLYLYISQYNQIHV